jgi:hypothetical protein
MQAGNHLQTVQPLIEEPSRKRAPHFNVADFQFGPAIFRRIARQRPKEQLGVLIKKRESQVKGWIGLADLRPYHNEDLLIISYRSSHSVARLFHNAK